MIKQTVRCAIYTRKSTEEGLEQEFNSLDAQRESAEAFIASQRHEGWECLGTRYDDGGFTGGNMERPGLRRLLSDIEGGKVDCVIVYKVDRLSRSLLDFARMMQTFEQHQVSFVSVTQQFNTASSMGRLILNVLLSFAQFEREMISERTRDKIAATRRKGKWSGGMPLLGYDVVDTKLVINEMEAERVRQIFQLYLDQEALMPTVKLLNVHGWKTKQWTTRKGTVRGGCQFTKGRLYQLLTNVTYVGRIRYKDEVHEGAHDGIVDVDAFERVQRTLSRNGQNGGCAVRNRYGALLKGVLRCATCDCAMTHTYTSKGNRRYRYYVCTRAQQRGWKECPNPSVPAAEIERFVIDQIKCIGRDPALLAVTLAETRRQTNEAIKGLKTERTALERQRRADEAQLGRCREDANSVEVQERITATEIRLAEIQSELEVLTASVISESEVSHALAEFDGVWESLTPKEQGTVLELLIECVDFQAGQVAITFRSTGIKALSEPSVEETAA